MNIRMVLFEFSSAVFCALNVSHYSSKYMVPVDTAEKSDKREWYACERGAVPSGFRRLSAFDFHFVSASSNLMLRPFDTAALLKSAHMKHSESSS